MKAIIVTSDAFPNGMATGKRILCYARALKEGGIDCEVLVCRRTERYGIPPKNTLGDGSVDGIHFHYIGGTPLRGDNVFIRRLNDCLDLLNTRRYLRETLRPGDILFLYLRNITPSLCFINVARRKGVKCVCDLCELPFGTGTETAKARRLRKKMLGVVFPRLDGIISISNALMELAQNHASPTCKHIKVPILVDFDHYYLPDRSMFADVPFIFHSGTLTQQKDGILGMIEAFGKAARSLPFPIQFISTGQLENSPHEAAIQDLIIRYDLQGKIRFTGFLSEDELFYMRSRGIPFAQARRLQLISFLWGVLSRLPSALADKISASL